MGPIGSGMSNAWNMQGLDGKFCIAKFRTGGDRTALSEILCAYLSRRFGPPLLEPVLMQLDKGQAEQISAERGRAGLPPVDPGRHFGARLSDSLLTVRSYSIQMGRGAAGSGTSNAEAAPGILGFGTLVQSHGRDCDNVGIEPDASGGRYSYRVFDYGLAFGGDDWSAESVADYTAECARFWNFALSRPPSGALATLRALPARSSRLSGGGWMNSLACCPRNGAPMREPARKRRGRPWQVSSAACWSAQSRQARACRGARLHDELPGVDDNGGPA